MSRTYGDYSLCVDHLRSRLIGVDPLIYGDEQTARIDKPVDALKESGKQIIAAGDVFSQSQSSISIAGAGGQVTGEKDNIIVAVMAGDEMATVSEGVEK